MATEADRFPREDHSTNKDNYKTDLALTGLLMGGLGMKHASSLTGNSCLDSIAALC
jgi:hypothetical protein